MPILDKKEADVEERYPGVHRWQVVDGGKGADGLSVGHLVFDPRIRRPEPRPPDRGGDGAARRRARGGAR